NDLLRRPLRSEIDSHVINPRTETGSRDPLPEPGLLEYWRVIRKHRWLIFAILAMAVASAGFVSTIMTPIFTAATVVLIDPRPPQVMDIKQVIAEPQRPENDLFTTQFEMLQSRSLIRDVIARERLMEHPLYRDAFAGADGPAGV